MNLIWRDIRECVLCICEKAASPDVSHSAVSEQHRSSPVPPFPLNRNGGAAVNAKKREIGIESGVERNGEKWKIGGNETDNNEGIVSSTVRCHHF